MTTASLSSASYSLARRTFSAATLARLLRLALQLSRADGACLHAAGPTAWTCLLHEATHPDVHIPALPTDDPVARSFPASDTVCILSDVRQRHAGSVLSNGVARDAYVRDWAGLYLPVGEGEDLLLSVYTLSTSEAPALADVPGLRMGLRDLVHLVADAARPPGTGDPVSLDASTANASLAFVEWDCDFRVVDWNPAAERIFGYTEAEAVGLHGSDLVPAAEWAHVETVWRSQLQKKGGYFNCNRNVTRSGAVILCEWYNTPVVKRAGDVVGVISLARDVTEREAAAHALRESKEFAENLITHMEDGVFVLDATGVLLQVNPAFCRMTGFSEEELVGASAPYPFWPRRAYDRLLDAHRETLRGDHDPQELTFVHKNGTPFPVAVRPAALRNDAGDVVAHFATVEDVTVQKEIEARLARERRLLRTIINTIPAALVIAPPHGGGVEVNDAFTEHVNGRRVVHTREGTETVYPLDVAVPSGVRLFLTALNDEWADRTVRDAEGEDVREMAWIARELADGTRLGLGVDVTARKRHEVEMERAKEEAEVMNRLKTAFLANMSHEIRTPLTSILGFAEVMRDTVRDIATEPSDLSLFLDHIQSGGERLLRTLNAVLELSRLEAGMLHLDPAPIHVETAVADAVALVQDDADAAGVRLTTSTSAAQPAAMLDRAALQRVLVILLSNAVKFTPEGGRVHLEAELTGARLRVTVTDTGIGIDPVFQPRMFEPFEQESTGPGRSHEGTGLGLAVAQGLVRLMNGTITVDSDKARGTRIQVTIPSPSV